MTNKLVASVILPALLSVLVSNAHADRAIRVQDAIWANDTLYDTILTDTNFHSPPAHSTDALYNFGMSGLMGQRAVAESAPGDHDYNGGRWDVKLVMFTTAGLAVHDPDGDGTANFELTSAAAVLEHEMLGHITIMDANHYFECPLLR
jgi:hypothetical protein